MPSPVSVARQCLAEEAAAALDEAVSVAKRRSHSQTTSLHVISALLSSTIREACSRARSSACSPRLQFRALELCVGVALDRLSTAKSSAEPPPVSNSLMAAIKRSQANQRRHPDTFHMYQRQAANSDSITSISAVKVELKHFVLSILDDPVVSRVFADAGFRTNDLKWAVMNPILPSRALNFNLDKDVPNFPFNLGDPISNTATRRIGQVLLMEERRNPLLIGTSADEALRSFIDSLNTNETGLVPEELKGLTVVSIKQELVNGEVESKLNQLTAMLQISQGRPGVIVDSGDLKSLLDVDSVNIANRIVSGLRRLLIDSAGKLWVIGSLATDQLYNRLVERFPTIERDWDLHLVPITSSTGGTQFKSSLMGSFVPFGGFFTIPSELNSLHATPTKSSSLCKSCNEKYESEVSTTVKDTATGLNSQHSVNLPSWLSSSECETSKKSDGIEARKHDTVLDARVRALHRKWSDICQRLHSSQIYEKDIYNPKSQIFGVPSLHSIPTSKNSADVGLFINGIKTADSNPCITKPNISGPVLLEEVENVLAEEPLHGVSSSNGNEPSASQQELIVPIAYTSSSSVTTDLGLGTFYASSEGCKSSKILESTSGQFSDKHVYMKDLEYPWKVLAEKVYWQIDAIRTISRTVSCRKSSKNGNVWLSFLGPDKVGMKKIAAGMAEIVFGGKQNLFSLDLRSQDRNHPSTSIACYDLKYDRLKSGRKMIVDHLAEELSKRPNSVVLLENIEQADIFVQNSLSQAIRTGKFPDSCGRDINVNNVIFALMSASLKVGRDPPLSRAASEFTEENILEAKNVQMQILIRSLEGNINSNSAAKFSVMCSKIVSVNKRKLIGCESRNAEILKRSRSMIDLNLPVENMEEECSDAEKCDSNNDSSQSSGKLLEEFLENVDENVVFQPFDFDTLSREILNEIDVKLKRVVGTNKVLLEIDREVMLQILAAAWLTDRSDTLQDWIENVLCSTIKECLRKCNVASGVVVQLLPLNGTVVEELACGLCLPSRIIVN